MRSERATTDDDARLAAADLLLDCRPVGANGHAVLTATAGEVLLHQDKVDLTAAVERERFAVDLCNGRPGVDGHAVRQRLLELAADHERAVARRSANFRAERGRTLRAKSVESYRPFPVQLLPRPVADFVINSADALGCDPAFIALPLLAALAAAIGNSRRLRLKGGWSEPSVLWTVLVADSGSLKSPAIERALRHVYRRQKRILKEHARAVAEHAEEHKAWKAVPKGERGDEPDRPPAPPHVLCSDVTVEALADRLGVSPRGILVAVDELAQWFASFDKYRSGGKGADLAHYLTMHRAGLLKVDRKTGDRTTLFVPNAAVYLTGGIQPDILRRSMTSDAFASGLAARLLLAMPPRRPKRWTEAEVDPAVDQALSAVFDGLQALKAGQDLDGDPDPVELDLTPAGKAAWVRFYNEHAGEQAELDGGELAAWSKLEGYAARLALIVHLCTVAAREPDAHPDRVDELSVAAGVELARWFGHEARRVYARLAEPEADRELRELTELVRSLGGRATPRDLQQKRRRYRYDGPLAKADLDKLATAGLGKWESPPPGPRGGHPTTILVLTEQPVIGSTDADVTTAVTYGGPVPLGRDESVNVNATASPLLPSVGFVDGSDRPGLVGGSHTGEAADSLVTGAEVIDVNATPPDDVANGGFVDADAAGAVSAGTTAKPQRERGRL